MTLISRSAPIASAVVRSADRSMTAVGEATRERPAECSGGWVGSTAITTIAARSTPRMASAVCVVVPPDHGDHISGSGELKQTCGDHRSSPV